MATVTTMWDMLDALVTAARTANPNGAVFDGVPVDDNTEDSELYIGVSDVDGEDPQKSVEEGEQNFQGTGKIKNERYTINCCAIARDGDGISSTARRAAGLLVTNLQTALLADPTVSATIGVLFVNFAIERVEQIQNDEGAVAFVYFSVAVLARLS